MVQDTRTMPINSQWVDPQHGYVSTAFIGEWRWDELHSHEQNELGAHFDSIRGGVILMDMRQGVWIKPSSLVDEIRLSAQFHAAHNIRLVIIMLADVPTGKLLVQYYQRNGAPHCSYIHATSLEQANTLIQKHISAY